MNYLLDTCVVSDLFKKHPQVVSYFETLSPRQINISTVSVMEIEYGLMLNPLIENKIRPLWEALVQTVNVLQLSHQDAAYAAQLRALLKSQGQPIGAYDILLGGMACARQLIFVTSNTKEFIRLPGIELEDWRSIHSSLHSNV